ncbi:DUF58 domain-containing protein [Luteolibacter flavescens]|uniref:DUF58 domain-containing protein n=1 Tax=Luteolibacter flavescens TaxID=1859460 RepID=A0ABT3FSU3_9BACT|nr:DUF58 domain-containing protein [Luteolibacter flavescens]MCW1886279.1 DUF58 domain-containing protein [Luteolibacter flavescens]
MSPTARALGIVVAWALFGLAASVWRELVTPWWISAVVLAVTALVDGIVLKRFAPVEISRRLPGRFAVGEASDVRLDVRNPGRFPAVVEIFDGIPAGGQAEAMPWAGTIQGSGGKARVTHPVRLIERGMASFGKVHVQRTSLLGLWRRRHLAGEAEQVKVYPDYEPVLKFALLAMQARQEQMGIVRKAYAGSSRDFHQLREYREGDPMSQIDWKATSRRVALISREFQEQRNQIVIFLTDTGRRMRAMDGELPQFDHCLNAMLLLSYVALRQGDQVGVQAFGGTNRWLPPVKGAHSMAVLLNHLFDYQTTPEPSDFAAAAESLLARQKRRALVVVMTNLRGEDSSELIPALRLLRSKHLVMLASLRERSVEDARTKPIDEFSDALRFAAAERYDAERAEVLATLQGSGILTVDVPAQQFPIALANRYLDIKAAGRL